MPTAPNLILFFGRLHPLLVHLPIGFLTLLALIELLSRLKRFKGVGEARGVILCATIVATILTITCGLMLSTGGGYDPSLLFWHKWMGITLGTGIIVCGYAFWKHQPRLYTTALIAILLLLGPASHFGGSMTHGKNYLFAYAPLWLRPSTDSPAQPVARAEPIRGAAQADVYADLVQPIFAQNCIGCHGSDRTSGSLRLDTIAFIKHGGQSGPAILLKKSAQSLLIQRLSLPPQDSRHMPPEGKPQPSDDQIDMLKWWIDDGAPEKKLVGDLNPSDDQLAMANRLLKIPLPTDAPAAPPIPIADAQAQIAALSPKIGIVATPFAVDQPWIIVNAALNHAFGDAELAQLGALGPNIVDLNLAGTHITDAGLAGIESMSNLKRLRLDRTTITDSGLLHIAKLTKLDYLNLYSTGVTDSGLKTLAALPSLRHLYLWKTKVDPSAATAFAASRTDASKIDQLKAQIERLREQISAATFEVVLGLTPATRPTTVP
jgi:uncharacterized membrane protein